MTIKIGNKIFVRTCEVCPEQYEVYDKSRTKHLCYVRLRWGRLAAYCPDVGGACIYEADIGGDLTGAFYSMEERMEHLSNIAVEIDKFYKDLEDYSR